MRPELLDVIINVTDKVTIQNMCERMSSEDLSHLFNMLEFTDSSTQQRWIQAYNELFKRVH